MSDAGKQAACFCRQAAAAAALIFEERNPEKHPATAVCILGEKKTFFFFLFPQFALVEEGCCAAGLCRVATLVEILRRLHLGEPLTIKNITSYMYILDVVACQIRKKFMTSYPIISFLNWLP